MKILTNVTNMKIVKNAGKENRMKSEKEIIEKLAEYQWYNDFIIETPEAKGVIEALEWVLGVDTD